MKSGVGGCPILIKFVTQMRRSVTEVPRLTGVGASLTAPRLIEFATPNKIVANRSDIDQGVTPRSKMDSVTSRFNIDQVRQSE